MSVHHQQGKANVVDDAFSRLSMINVSQIDDAKKELVIEVHQLARLGVQLVDIQSGGVSVHSLFESSFVVDVKSKQHLDPVFMELKGSLLSKLLNELFSLWGIVFLDTRENYVCPILIILYQILLKNLMASGIQFIKDSPRIS